jgi:UDP-3-O-[3-hydroxymyristoyl] glucosamine N-acyltransferase
MVTRVAALDAADGASLSFLSATRYQAEAQATQAGIVLVTRPLVSLVASVPARIVVDTPQEAMLTAIALLHPVARLVAAGVHPTAVIGDGATVDPSAALGARVVVGAGATIGRGSQLLAGVVVGDDVVIGADCVLHPNVTLYSGTVLGDRVSVQAGAVIGADGFGYVFARHAHQKIPHVGRCLIESDVEIGANSTVDRGSVGDTVIGAGSKLDNLVHVGHNVRIGKLCLLMAQVGISGSARLGDGVVVAGQAGLAGHISIGSGARIAGQAGVFGDVPAGETWSGYPARPHRESLRVQAAAHQLPALLRDLRRKGTPE